MQLHVTDAAVAAIDTEEQNPSILSTVSSSTEVSLPEESQPSTVMPTPISYLPPSPSPPPPPPPPPYGIASITNLQPNPNPHPSNYHRPHSVDRSFYYNQYDRVNSDLYLNRWPASYWNFNPNSNLGLNLYPIWLPQQQQWGILPTAPLVAPFNPDPYDVNQLSAPGFYQPHKYDNQFYTEGNATYFLNPTLHPAPVHAPAQMPIGCPQSQLAPYFPETVMLHREVPLVMTQIRKQIEYYFSDINLKTDEYLKRQMNSFGWVDIRLIAGFRKVAALTKDLDMIRKALMYSGIVELRGDKMRKRYTWEKWILRRQNFNSLETGMQNMQLAE